MYDKDNGTYLSDFAFVSMYNFTLARRDANLAYVKSGIKQDTLAALRQAPLEAAILFPDALLRKAEEDISKFEDRGHSQRISLPLNDNQSIFSKDQGRLTGNTETMDIVNSIVACPVLIVSGQLQKKGLSPVIVKSVIKMCEQYFLCRSLVFCQTCTKCQTCCTKSACRSQTKSILGNMGSPRGGSKGHSNLERGLHSTLSNQAQLGQVTLNHQLLCTSSQEPLPVGGITSVDKQKRSRVSQKSRISRVLQQTIFSPKTKQQMATYTGSKQSQQIPQGGKIQNGDPRNDSDLPTDRGVGDHKLQGRLLPYAHSNPIKEISPISCTGQNIPIQSTSVWSGHSSPRVYYCDQRSEADGFAEGYKDPPVPRRLVGPGHIPPNLSLAYTNVSSSLSGVRLVSEHGKVGTGPQTSF